MLGMAIAIVMVQAVPTTAIATVMVQAVLLEMAVVMATGQD